jgi:hypothetical protein
MNTLGKMLALDGMFALFMWGLAKYAPETKRELESTAQGALEEVAPELAQQVASLKAGE